MNHRIASVVRTLIVGYALALAERSFAGESVFENKSPGDPNDIIYGGRGVSTRSGVAGVCSLVIPGIGQAINKNATKKIVTHVVVGLVGFVGLVHPVGFVFGLFHIWSFWDALIDRRGGYINGAVMAPDSNDWLDASVASASSSC